MKVGVKGNKACDKDFISGQFLLLLLFNSVQIKGWKQPNILSNITLPPRSNLPFFCWGVGGGVTQWRESNDESSKAKNQEKVVTQRSQATFECILAENFPEPIKDIYFQIQEAPNKVNERNYI